MSANQVSCSTILAAARTHICTSLPFANYHSVPIPTIWKGRLCAGVLIGRGEFTSPSSGYRVWRPHLLALFSAADGSLEELRGIGRETREHDIPLGGGVAPVDKASIGYLESQAKYCQLADEVLASAKRGDDYSPWKVQLVQRFEECSGVALLPYFEGVFMHDRTTRDPDLFFAVGERGNRERPTV